MSAIIPRHAVKAAPVPASVDLSSTPGWRGAAMRAGRDLGAMMRQWKLVVTLGLFDIRLRYRGSVLGPFWLTLSTAIMVAAIGFLYTILFHQRIDKYLPFLTVSLVLWNFISTVTSEGATCFTQAEGMIRNMRMPHSLHPARMVLRNLLVFAHNVVVVLVVLLIFRIPPGFADITLLPAAFLWCVDGFALGLLLGMIGARFRDTPPIIASLMQIVFYLTPVIWNPSMLHHRGVALVLVELNPFYAMLEIMRGPLLGAPLDPVSWMVAVAYSTFLLLLAATMFTWGRARIPYWV